MTAPRLAVVGSFNLDTVALLDDLPAAHTKTRATAMWTGPGGSATITAAWLAFGGAVVDLHSAAGREPETDRAIALLEKLGVNCASVMRTSGPSSRALSLLTGEEKRIITYSQMARHGDLEQLVARVASFDAIHVAAAPDAQLTELARAAQNAGVRTSLELAGRWMPEVSRHCERVFLNADEWTALRSRGLEPLDVLAPNGRLVVTDGRHGAREMGGSRDVFVSANRVRPLDRTGGGDAFNAGYLAASTAGASAEECLEAGLELARLAIMTLGGMPPC